MNTSGNNGIINKVTLYCLILTLMPWLTFSAPMGGNYTIDASMPTAGTNYQSFTAFSAALSANGVSGNVIATVVAGSGPYTEQVVFQMIAGTGPSASVTIEGNNETITAVTSTTDRHVIRLSSLQYFTINNLQVDYNPASTGGFYGIHIFNTGNNITISNCDIDISGTTSTLYGSIVASGSETSILTTGDFHNISITDNTTTGGGYGVSLFGLVSNLASGINISGNNINDYHSNGIYLRETDGAIISNNILDKKTNSFSFANGIQMAQSANVNATIYNNIISVSQPVTGTTIQRGIYLFGGSGHKVYNNLIHNINLTGADFSGIEIREAGSAPEIYFNTIAIDNAAATTGVLTGIGEELSNTNSILRNNVISITQTSSSDKAGLVLATNSSVSTGINSNYNLIYVSGGNVAMKASLTPVYYATLAAWQSAGGNDANSLSLDPQFTSSTVSVPTNALAFDAGITIATITTDITGLVRGTPPDVGAYEFSPTSITEQSADHSLIYPNPASDILYIKTDKSGDLIEVYDIEGKIVITKLTGAGATTNLDISRLLPGKYLVRFNGKSFAFSKIK